MPGKNKCPVCLQSNKSGEPICQQCGWELESEKILGDLSNGAKATYQRRLEIAQYNWHRLIKSEQQNQEEVPKGSDIQEQINAAMSEKNLQVVIWLAEKWLAENPDDHVIRAVLDNAQKQERSHKSTISIKFEKSGPINQWGMIQNLPLREKFWLTPNKPYRTKSSLKKETPYLILISDEKADQDYFNFYYDGYLTINHQKNPHVFIDEDYHRIGYMWIGVGEKIELRLYQKSDAVEDLNNVYVEIREGLP